MWYVVDYQVDLGFVLVKAESCLLISRHVLLMMKRAWSMGMVVLSEVTSRYTIISSGSIFFWYMKAENDLELWVCCSFSFP